MLKKLSMLFGAVFVLVGILGFIPGITTDGHLLGIFEVGALHNIIHIVSGLAFFYGAKSEETASMVFKVFGVVYALVTVIGFVQGDTVLGLISTNMADHILHLVLSIAILAIGFGMKPSMQSAMKPPMNPSM